VENVLSHVPLRQLQMQETNFDVEVHDFDIEVNDFDTKGWV
jgi:hypothetical protein